MKNSALIIFFSLRGFLTKDDEVDHVVTKQSFLSLIWPGFDRSDRFRDSVLHQHYPNSDGHAPLHDHRDGPSHSLARQAQQVHQQRGDGSGHSRQEG